MEVVHGTYDSDGDGATLMVFRFRFDPQKRSRRIIRARINIEFFSNSKNGTAPIVDAIAPEERWSVTPTIDSKTTTRGGDLSLGASGVPFLVAGGTLKFEKTVDRDVTDATTVTGSINLGTGKNSGESTVAVWNLQENKRRQTGVPDSVKAAILLCRENSDPFNTRVTLEVDADFITGLERKFSKVPLDDPVLFNPTPTAKKPKKGRSYDAQDLSNIDLYSLCAVRMGMKAHFGGEAQ